jgi:asparagine synthase (glutamine-hydrolysing)
VCGIAGIFAYRDPAPPVDREELLRIREQMHRRGPDGAGLWLSGDGRVGLAHRRLAIIDLSETGAQPMASADGRYLVTFNGEIYNYRELRSELEARGSVFRSQSDTEVLLHLHADRGERMVEALRGMFAFALWDNVERTLLLARDPFGIKPLYYADDGKTFRFGSQVKALLAGNAIGTAPEPAGSVGFLLLGSVPEPYTLYRNIRSLPAGSTLRVRDGGGSPSKKYFDVGDTIRLTQDAAARRAPANLGAAVRDSVKAHLVSDVPVGIFLSAGIDSGTIAGLASETGATDLHAVTLGFREFRDTPNDEAPLAREVAGHYGVEHRVEWIEREDFERELPAILAAMDQPSIDGVNTYLVSRAAARVGMKVALSGLGGDEFFGGYPSFRQVPALVRSLRWTRQFTGTGVAARKLTQRWIGRVASPKYAGLLEYGGTMGGGYLLRRGLFMPWELDDVIDPRWVRAGLDQLDIVARLDATAEGLRTSHAKIAALEIVWYMRNQLLRDADWAGMAHSLEIRVPLVDAALFKALAASIASPASPTKLDLASLPNRPVPTSVVRRAKSGFTTPVREWIGAELGAKERGLRKWARSVLPALPRPLRVLALVSDAYGGHGGIAKFNRELLGSIAAMPDCAEVVCLPRVISRPIEVIPDRVRFVTAAARGKLRYMLGLARALADGPYDLLIIGHINLAAIGVRAARQLGIPSQLIVHGIDAWTPHRRRAVRNSLGATDRIVGVSQLTLDRFNRWAKVDAASQRVLPNSVDLERFVPGPKPADLVEALGLSGKKVLMTFGRLAGEERYKGFDEIIELMPALATEIPDVVYLICGDGPDRGRLEAKCRKLNVAGRVVFAGFVDEERKPDYYRLADAYVMPSCGEGFGIVFLEALACGIPVLGSCVDGGREALLDGQLGELVDPSRPDEIRAGILRTLRRERGVPPGLEQFSREAFGERVASIVDDLLDTTTLGAKARRRSSSLRLLDGAHRIPDPKSILLDPAHSDRIK